MKDVRGVDLAPGQTVAFATTNGNASLRIGIIEELVEAHGKVTIRWEQPAYGPKVSTITVNGEYVKRPRLCVVHCLDHS